MQISKTRLAQSTTSGEQKNATKVSLMQASKYTKKRRLLHVLYLCLYRCLPLGAFKQAQTHNFSTSNLPQPSDRQELGEGNPLSEHFTTMVSTEFVLCSLQTPKDERTKKGNSAASNPVKLLLYLR